MYQYYHYLLNTLSFREIIANGGSSRNTSGGWPLAAKAVDASLSLTQMLQCSLKTAIFFQAT